MTTKATVTLEQYFQQHLKTVPLKSAQSVLELHAEGATVPFIARYRKEKTGNLDEVQIRAVIEAKETFEEATKRQVFILKEIEEQGQLTDVLKKRILATLDIGELEEIYRPYKKKKKTKATLAREAGLEPLANWIWQVGHGEVKAEVSLEVKAKDFLNVALKIATYDAALKAAQDIIIENISNQEDLREKVRKAIFESGKLVSKKAKEYKENSKYSMYADFSDPIKSLQSPKASHRYLAMRRGWQENELTLTVEGDTEVLQKLYTDFACTQPKCVAAEYLNQAAKLAFTAYVFPSITNEVHRVLKDTADTHAIEVFAQNVRKVLLASPLGPKCTVGVDPGLRTGCKVALVDKSGHYLSSTVLHVLGDDAAVKAKKLFAELFKQIQVDAIAVGNGTAGRETESFLRKIVKELESQVPVILVNESGASVYSASDIAREEFPDLDLTVRGAISIARRLQDPLAELVKVDPKSIGVGQYQHDVSQTNLKKNLDFVVESCVNQVGVDVNTASAALLSYVSGIGPALAKNIMEFRKEKGLLKDRYELLNIPRFSSKIFEQSAGFLRINSSTNPLDKTGIHPERYAAVKDMAQDLGCTLGQLVGAGAKEILKHRTKWVELVGEYTFDDIVKELEKPGRDPRGEFKPFSFREDIHEVKDLKEGMICPGIVTNVTNFGAFVDIGVHQDGLVHISMLANKFVDDPRKVVNPGDHVTVKVLGIDAAKNQISLTMRLEETQETRAIAKESREQRQVAPRQPQASNSRPAGSVGGKSGGKGFHGDRGRRDERPRNDRPQMPQRPAFGNNPFASLADLKTQIKK